MKRAFSSPSSLEYISDKEFPVRKPTNYTNSTKKSRFDINRAMANDDENELEQERERNSQLMAQISGFQQQIQNLTEQVAILNQTILSMQAERTTLLKIFESKGISSENAIVTQNAIESINIETVEHEGDGESDTKNANEIEMKTTDDNVATTEKEGEEEKKTVTDETHSVDAKPQTNTIKRTNKVPPIDIWTVNRAEIQRIINSALPPDSCLFSRINNTKFRVFPRDVSVRTSLIELLEERKYDFNTYTPSDEKMINVIIRGLEHIEDEQVILDELAENGFVPHKVQKYITGYMRHNKIGSNLWRVTLLPNTDTSQLFQIKAIDHAIIKWEFLKKPKIVQCKRCQRLFHSASNCKLPFRCVKCIDNHEPGQCKIDGNNKLKPKCVNCKGEHTANDFKNCPYFQKAIASQDERSGKSKNNSTKTNKQSKPAVSTNSSKVTDKVSFADHFKQNKEERKPKQKQTSNQTQSSSILEKFIENQNTMMMQFMETMANMQQQFISSFSNGR